jgi:leucyl aminopeptidase
LASFGRRQRHGHYPTAENSPDANAQRPGDIFSQNGKSIMVDNTDAEGRLILTDGCICRESKATHILDIATLTGAIVRALATASPE